MPDMKDTLKLFCVKPLPVCMTAGFISFLSISYSSLFLPVNSYTWHGQNVMLSKYRMCFIYSTYLYSTDTLIYPHHITNTQHAYDWNILVINDKMNTEIMFKQTGFRTIIVRSAICRLQYYIFTRALVNFTIWGCPYFYLINKNIHRNK